MNWKAILVAAMVLIPDPALAQHAIVLQKLTEWDKATPPPPIEVLQNEARAAARRAYPTTPTCADAGIEVGDVRPATADRFVFNAIVRRTMRNAWTMTANVPGCDVVPIRLMTMQASDGSLTTIRVNRGVSLAWDSLIGDTLPLAQVGASAALERAKVSCELKGAAKLGVIRVVSQEAGLGPDIFGARYAGSWEEVWPIDVCGRTVEMVVQFTADGDGGAYQRIAGDRALIKPE